MWRCSFLLFAWAVSAQQPDSTLQSLVNAERSFAALSVAEGMRDAFLANLAEDGIVFRPGPVNGLEVWKSRKAIPVLLTWEPETADVASSGDLGFTTGPWEARDYGPRKNPPAFGYYMSVWRRQADGVWKVLLDLGTGNKKPDSTSVHFHPMPSFAAPSGSAQDTARARSNLISAEMKLSQTIRDAGFTSGERAYFHEGARIHRDGLFPLTRAKTLEADSLGTQKISYENHTFFVSRAIDFACVYGDYRIADEFGNFVRLWKRSGSNWKVILDLTSPHPAK